MSLRSQFSVFFRVKMIALSIVSVFVFFHNVRSFDVQVQDGNFSEEMDFTLNSTVRLILMFQPQQNKNPYTINAWSISASSKHPVLVEVELEEDTLSWTVPLILYPATMTKDKRQFFSNTSRILCDKNLFENRFKKDLSNFTVTLSTSSDLNVDLSLRVVEDTSFYVQRDKEYSILLLPSQPLYFYYKLNCSKFCTLIIEIDSSDDVCLTASIQENQCPVFDLGRDMLYVGVHQTINRKGGLRIDGRKFPDGFLLVLVAQVDNYLCNTRLGPFPNQTPRNRNAGVSTVNFLISKGNNDRDYSIALLVPFALIVFFCFINFVVVCICFRLKKIKYLRLIEDTSRDPDVNGSAEMNQEAVHDNEETAGSLNRHSIEEENERIEESQAIYTQQGRGEEEIRGSAESVLLATEQHNGKRTLADFAHEKNQATNSETSQRYCKYTLSTAIFYIIPVAQLMYTYQKVMNSTGNSDLCYYNFRCANPGPWFLSDLNHVYSNIGYIIIGVFFLGVVLHRQSYLPGGRTGVQVNYGIFYAMGTSLIAEGVLSACYHVCPNRPHFQFDTSFMYVMAVLCMIKLYQNRHSDITPSAGRSLIVLVIIISFATFGLLVDTNVVLGYIAGICYFLLSIYISFKIYYFGSVVEKLKQLGNRNLNRCEALRPQEKSRFVNLFIVSIINWVILGLVVYGYINNMLDFGTLLLILLMLNAILYTIIYTIMKFICGERRPVPEVFIYGSLCVVCWGVAGYFFYDSATEWSLSPAQSRFSNQECIWFNFYDKHDLWHLLSAPALFCTFMYLLYLDDDIIHKNRRSIDVF